MGTGYSIKAKSSIEGEIFIYEDVGDSFFGGITAKQFADDLKGLGSVKTINLHINSSGGDVFDGLAIYRLLVENEAKVISFIDGLAASIASVIAMAGNEIRISQSGFLMVHEAWGRVIGNSTDMMEMAAILEKTTNSVADVYIKRTKKKKEKVYQWLKAETWFNAEEAIANGFADTMMENLQVAAHVDMSKHNFKNLPESLAGRPLYENAIERFKLQRAKIQQKGLQAA